MSLGPVSRRTALQWSSAALIGATISIGPRVARGAVPRVLADGQTPTDKRLGALKDLNGYFPFTPSKTPEEWDQRAEYVRRQLLVACGLWPMPARPAIEATIHGKVDRGDYTVEKVYFESHPGLYVTGSLYRPKNATGKRPTIISPHGHWANGRFHDHGEAKIKTEITSGAETDDVGGRHPLQARCVQLARMGCVVFLYDMLGVADNTVLSGGLIHGFSKQRPDLSTPERWGLFSAQSELRCLNALGLQTWNSIRILDWITTLPDVDPDKIGVTGASGGGTQTFMLGAVDPRPKALFPAVMVSTAMQGGCTCENATYLRVNTGNIEFAAMIAPRPLGMTAANDWTRELETKGLPELKQHYAMLNVPDRVRGKHYPFEHNYNKVSRQMMYEFFKDALALGDVSLEEREFKPLTQEEASVWVGAPIKPKTGDDAEVELLWSFAREFQVQLDRLKPTDAPSLVEYKRVVGGGWDILIGRDLASTGSADLDPIGSEEKDGYREYVGWIRNRTHGESCPATMCVPLNWNQQVVIWLTETGKAGLFTADGTLKPHIQKVVSAGTAVMGIDLLYQGELSTDGETLTETPRVNNPREFLGYTVGYNHPLFSQRVHDVLSTIVGFRNHPMPPSAIHLVGEGKAGLIAAAAAVQAGDTVRKLAVLSDGFRFGSVTNIRDPWLLPGAVRYGDVPGLLALRATTDTMVISPAGTVNDDYEVFFSAQKAAGVPAAGGVTIASSDNQPGLVPGWLR